MKIMLTNFKSLLTIFCLIVSGLGFQDELCEPGYAEYIDNFDVNALNYSRSTVTWMEDGRTIEWSAGNDFNQFDLEIEFNSAKNITEIHTGKRTTISFVKMIYSKDGNEWDYRYLLDNKKNEEEIATYSPPLSIKYLKFIAVAFYANKNETYMDFKIVACHYNDILK